MDIFGEKEILSLAIACSQSLYFLLRVRRARVIKTDFENKEKKNKATSTFFLSRAPRSPNKTTSVYRLFLSLLIFFYFYKIQFVKYYKNKKATCKDSQGRLTGVATVTQERFFLWTMLYSIKNCTTQIYCQRVFIWMVIMTIGFRPQT